MGHEVQVEALCHIMIKGNRRVGRENGVKTALHVAQILISRFSEPPPT